MAIDVLHTVLDNLCRVTAPLLPLLTEEIWADLTGDGSVHLSDWPDPEALPADPDLVGAMDEVRAIASAAKSVRETRGLRRRLPLRTLTIAADDTDALEPFRALLADEVNVKAVEFTDAGALGVERFEVDLRNVGKRLAKVAAMSCSRCASTAVRTSSWCPTSRTRRMRSDTCRPS